ncbi:unnamed protein product, partial [Mesorhabditis belari]|uniref:Uncharacterized protein n=1 Tax=Mesorhabditis belari TaxID=2138241 RepID=A0AAF3FAN9_9BILA
MHAGHGGYYVGERHGEHKGYGHQSGCGTGHYGGHHESMNHCYSSGHGYAYEGMLKASPHRSTSTIDP